MRFGAASSKLDNNAVLAALGPDTASALEFHKVDRYS
jgi:hypothetical protein